MVEYKDRLAEAMRDAGMSKQQLADALRISYQAVKKVLDGASKSLSAANNEAAADALKVNSLWLATGKGPKRIGGDAGQNSVREPTPQYEATQRDPWLSEAVQTLQSLNPEDRRAAVLNLRVFVSSLTPPGVGQALRVAGEKGSR